LKKKFEWYNLQLLTRDQHLHRRTHTHIAPHSWILVLVFMIFLMSIFMWYAYPGFISLVELISWFDLQVAQERVEVVFRWKCQNLPPLNHESSYPLLLLALG
jgi:hypothetical protein